MTKEVGNTEIVESPPRNSVKVAIIEDEREIREGLGFLISSTEGFVCNGRFGSMEEALANIGRNLPDVALVDICLPGISGIEGTKLLKKRWPELLVVTLTVYGDDERVFEALCAGSSGYLLKKTPPSRLIESLRDVVSGGAPISPEVASRVIRLFSEFRPPRQADCHLTPQELRILKLLVEGHSYKTAAAELDCSVNTVAFHMQSIYRKLEVHSKSEAVVKALRGRLV